MLPKLSVLYLQQWALLSKQALNLSGEPRIETHSCTKP